MSRSILQITGPRSEYDSDDQYQRALWRAGFEQAARDKKETALRGMIASFLILVIGGAVGWAFAYQHLMLHF